MPQGNGGESVPGVQVSKRAFESIQNENVWRAKRRRPMEASDTHEVIDDGQQQESDVDPIAASLVNSKGLKGPAGDSCIHHRESGIECEPLV